MVVDMWLKEEELHVNFIVPQVPQDFDFIEEFIKISKELGYEDVPKKYKKKYLKNI